MVYTLFFSFLCFVSPIMGDESRLLNDQADEVIMVTMAIGHDYQAVVWPGIEKKRQYCLKHKYGFVCGIDNLDIERPIAWTKVRLILKVMEENPKAKWIFWTDADSLIMNQKIKLNKFIDKKFNLIITKDFNNINSGQFFIKNCKWSRNLLLNIYKKTNCIFHPWWENQALIEELQENPELSKYIKYYPQRKFNSYPGEFWRKVPELIPKMKSIAYQPGDFIIHFAGIRGQELKQYIEKYLNIIEHDYLNLP